jgi:hypothetical protein
MLTPNYSLLNTQQTLNKCTEGHNFNNCYMDSTYIPSVKDYTNTFCMVYKGNVPSLQQKMRTDQTKSRSYFRLL